MYTIKKNLNFLLIPEIYLPSLLFAARIRYVQSQELKPHLLNHNLLKSARFN
jgi:hypothetical protein